MVEVHHTSKQCGKCREVKPLAAFHRKASRKDGYQTWCKECACSVASTWRAENPERHKAANLRWYTDNVDKVRAYDQRKYEADPLKAAENNRNWRVANRDKHAAKIARRRARERQACPSWADQSAIAAIYAEAARITQETGIPHEVDHIVPLGGTTVCGLHVPENLRVIPAGENRRKSNKVLA